MDIRQGVKYSLLTLWAFLGGPTIVKHRTRMHPLTLLIDLGVCAGMQHYLYVLAANQKQRRSNVPDSG